MTHKELIGKNMKYAAKKQGDFLYRKRQSVFAVLYRPYNHGPMTILILVLMISGCEGKPKDNVYHKKEIDSLSFLIKNSDLIALVKISDGLAPMDKPATEFKEAVEAKIVELIYGETERNPIEILNTTVFTSPGIVEPKLYLSNGEFIYFLKKFGGSYKPLTPFSTVLFRNGKGAPIWKQDENG